MGRRWGRGSGTGALKNSVRQGRRARQGRQEQIRLKKASRDSCSDSASIAARFVFCLGALGCLATRALRSGYFAEANFNFAR